MAAITNSSSISFNQRVGQDRVSPSKSYLDHVADYFSTATGLNDAVKVINYSLQWFTNFVPVTEGQANSIGSIRNAIDITGTVLSLPDLFTSFAKTVKAVASLQAAQALPEDAPERRDQMHKAIKDTILNGISWVNALTDSAGNLHGIQVIDLGKAAPFVSGLFHLTQFVSDGNELVSEVLNVQENLEKMALTVSEEKKAVISQNNNLSLINIAKCVASIAVTILSVGTLCFAGVISGISIVPISILFFSSIWLAMKISSYFYEKIVVENQKETLKLPNLV
jgi:hypothetical protein